jgi:hypothetical protein
VIYGLVAHGRLSEERRAYNEAVKNT